MRNVATNTSTINWTLTSTGGADDYYSTGPTTAKINGKQVYYKARTAWSSYAFPAARGSVSGSTTVQHDAQGKCSIPVSLATAIYTSTVTTNSGTWTLESNPRGATILTASNFNDEGNPIITYSNPVGDAVDSLKACIANSTGTVVYADYRDISKVGSSYTFNLTDTERNALRWASINSPNLAVKFYVTTVVSGVTYYSTLDKIMTIVNAQPTITTTIKDIGTASTLLTGNENKIIKGLNYISASMTATAKKGASIKKQTIECGGVVLNGSGAFENVESADFIITATDSRGYTTTQTIKKELIDYVKPTCNLTVEKPTTDGETTLEIHGNYFNGSFGAVANTLTVQYRYKANDEGYNEWITGTGTINKNTYSATINVTGLDYRKAYTFQARVLDKAMSVSSVEIRVKAIPVFDWGENDFQFNVDVYDKDGGKLGSEMTASDYEAISLTGKEQKESGWVIITPTANTPTGAFVTFKRHYTKIPVVTVTASSGVIGTQVLGASINGITNDGVNIVLTRTNTTPTTVYYKVYGEAEE